MHAQAETSSGTNTTPVPPPRSAKGHLLNAGICQLCSADVASIRAAIDRYRDIDLNFDNSRECNFLSASGRRLCLHLHQTAGRAGLCAAAQTPPTPLIPTPPIRTHC